MKSQKKVLKQIFILILFLFPITVWGVELDINSNNAILYNLNENTILYEKGKEEKTSIASLTKIMTAVVAMEKIEDLEKRVTLTWEDFKGLREMNAAQAGFRVGETVTYKDLLYGLLLPSGAEAAQALARLTYGSVPTFVEKMNEKAQVLNLTQTHFANTTGLDEEGHYSSVEDVAKLFQYALKNEDFKTIISAKTYTTSGGNHTFESTIQKAIDAYHLELPYLIGGKTGTTGDAGLCLATIATYNNVNYLLVTVKAPYSKTNPGNYQDAKTIYEYFMNHYSYQKIVKKNELLVRLKTKYCKEDNVIIKSKEEIEKYLENNIKKEDIRKEYEGIKEITSKMEKGTKLGVVKIYYQDTLLDTINITLEKKQEFSYKKYLFDHKLECLGILLIVLLVILLLVKWKNNKNKTIKNTKTAQI